MSKKRTRVATAQDYDEDLSALLRNYNVYPALTAKLDKFNAPFDAATINEITLWKVNRYVCLSRTLLARLDGVRKLMPKEHRKAEALITALQKEKGVRLAMASTFFRFANPDVFQIIDRHADRALCGNSLEVALKKRDKSERTSLYLSYLDSLHDLCQQKKIPFRVADRILYVFDKHPKSPLKKKVSTR